MSGRKIIETIGRARLNDWLNGDSKEQTVSKLAKKLELKVPTVHGWKTGVSRPGPENRALLCIIIGGEPSDWDTAAERKANQARSKLAKTLGGEAA